MSKHPQTDLVRDQANPWSAVVPPIVQTSLFTFHNVEEMEARFRGDSHTPVYSRGDNPTVQEFERKLAALEGGEAARAFASGMAAISAAVLSVVRSGDRIVCVRHVYPDAYRFFEKLLSRLGVTVTYVDGQDTAAVVNAMQGASLLYLESPTSWTMQTQDLRSLASAARGRGVVTVIDNSWATPIHQQPLALGVDMVVHSASKYLSGHSDTVAGVVVASAAHIARINDLVHPYLGAKLSPLEGFLLLRGLRTLPMRLAQQWQTTELLLRRLCAHPAVAQVLHPWCQADRSALEKCDNGAAATQSLSGYSSLFSIVLHEGYSPRVFCNQLKRFQLGVSWGGHESLVVPAFVGLAQNAGPNSMLAFGVSPQMVRLYCGFEHVEDLWQDLEQALQQAFAHPST